MKLEEAIKINEQHFNWYDPRKTAEEIKAGKLGIEASKAYAQARRLGLPLRCEQLPSETEG